MLDYDQLYAQLENRLNEFFSSTTSNARKQEIEKYLEVVQNDLGAITFVLHFLGKCKNQYVLMYFLHALQVFVENRWWNVEVYLRLQTTDAVFQVLPQFYHSQPTYIFKKIAKLFADIGRLQYPKCFDYIFKYLSNENDVAFGLKLLKITIEEFQQVDNCLLMTSDDKLAFKNDFIKDTSAILTFLDEFIKNLIIALTNESDVNKFYNGWFYENVKIQCSSNKINILAQLNENQAKKWACTFDCLLSICQCADLSEFFDKIFLLDFIRAVSFAGVIRLSGDCAHQSDSSPAGESRDDEGPLESCALNCLSELAGRNFYSNNASVNLMERFNLLQFLYDTIYQANLFYVSENHDDSLVTGTCETWLKGIIELMRIFITHHIFRVEDSSSVVCIQLLENFAFLTHKFKNIDLFLQCTDVWHTFFEYLTANVDRKNERERYEYLNQKYKRLSEILVQLFASRATVTNNVLLSGLIDVEFGENYDNSDWCQYLTACIDILLKLGELYPLETFSLLKNAFNDKLSIYLKLNSEDFVVNLRDLQIIPYFQDFQCILKALGTLSSLFINENFWKFNAEARDLVEKLCQAIVFSGEIKLYQPNEHLDRKITEEASNLYSQFLFCIKSYCHWLAQFYAEAQRTGENNHVISAIITSTADNIISLLLNHQSTPNLMLRAASSTLFSILLTVRPQNYFLNMKNVNLLYEEACKPGRFASVPPEVYKILYCSLCNYLIIPWYNAVDCEQEWTHRKKLYQHMMKFLTADFLHLCNIQNQAFMDVSKAKHCADFVIPILIEMLESISNESMATKKHAFAVFKPIATKSLMLMNTCLSASLTFFEQLLSLMSSLFSVLVVQLGTDFTKETVDFLLNAMQSPDFYNSLKQETSTACKILELILKILSSITKEMTRRFNQFTESIINLALKSMKPFLSQISSVDLKTTFYELLYSLLIIRWRYFFPVSILASVENHVEEGSETYDKIEHEEQLLEILQAFGESLTECQPSIVKQNLIYLNKLNETRKLYKRPFFIKNLYTNFVAVLLNSLIHRTHPILNEDFCETLAQMTCSNPETFQLFRASLLEQFLSLLKDRLRPKDITFLLNKFPNDQEIPSFSVNLQNFANDVIVCMLNYGAKI